MAGFGFIAVGLALISAGFLLPLLMVLQLLEPGFAWSLSAYSSSVVGVLVALYGAFAHVGSRKQERD